ATEDANPRVAARPRAGNDIRVAVVVHVAHGHEHAAGEAGIKRRDRANQSAGCAAVHFDLRRAPWSAAGDDVGETIAVHVAAGYRDAAGKPRAAKERGRQATF